MDPERATAIQQALIKSGYLTGEPSGKWDPESIAAMQKLQSDNGWQTKIMPDSRALIKLGLGPGSTPPPAVAGPATTASTTSAPAPHTP
jgi:peptidoglycan hydrolase-like protein with peptidoglycan-binding domain